MRPKGSTDAERLREALLDELDGYLAQIERLARLGRPASADTAATIRAEIAALEAGQPATISSNVPLEAALFTVGRSENVSRGTWTVNPDGSLERT